MVAREAIVCLEALEGDRFEFPINPRGIKVRRGRSVNVVPILGLGEVVQPGSLVPVEISFDTLLLRYPDSTLNNYLYTEKPEQSIERLERWMGRTKEGRQENPHVIRVVVSKTGFSREMVLTEVGTDYREGEPDAIYISVTLKEWRRQVVRITQGTPRPLLESTVEAGDGSGGDKSPVEDDTALSRYLSSQVGAPNDPNLETTRPAPQRALFHTSQAGDTLYSVAERYGGDSGSARLFAEQVYTLNAHKWEPGGVYHNKFAYYDSDGNRITKAQFNVARVFHRPPETGDDPIPEGVTRVHLYQPPLDRNRQFQAIPPGVVLTLPREGGGTFRFRPNPGQ